MPNMTDQTDSIFYDSLKVALQQHFAQKEVIIREQSFINNTAEACRMQQAIRNFDRDHSADTVATGNDSCLKKSG